jgi:hypothetical protein
VTHIGADEISAKEKEKEKEKGKVGGAVESK